jgi:hypothetical protein
MAYNTMIDALRVFCNKLDGLLDLSDIASLITSAKVIYFEPSVVAGALLIFKGLHELHSPLVQRMMAGAMRPLNVHRARQVVQIYSDLQIWIAGPGPGLDPRSPVSYLFKPLTNDPTNTHWNIIMLSVKEWVWRNAAVVTVRDMHSHLHEQIELWTVHGPEALHASR